MAAWTQADLDLVDDAIRQLVAGAREVELTLQDRIVRYSDVKLEDLRAFRSEVAMAVAATSMTTTSSHQRIHRSIYSKGL